MIPDRFAPVLAELAPLAERFERAGEPLYLVGGTVRDLLLGLGDVGDFDLLTHVAYDQPPLTRRERAQNVIKRNYFAKYRVFIV